MFHRPDLHRKEPTVFSVIPNPPKSVSEMSHNGTASYMVYDAHPPAKRMRKIRGKGHWKSKDLDFASDASAPSAASAASAFSSTGCSCENVWWTPEKRTRARILKAHPTRLGSKAGKS